jgi:hypothetical protein
MEQCLNKIYTIIKLFFDPLSSFIINSYYTDGVFKINNKIDEQYEKFYEYELPSMKIITFQEKFNNKSLIPIYNYNGAYLSMYHELLKLNVCITINPTMGKNKYYHGVLQYNEEKIYGGDLHLSVDKLYEFYNSFLINKQIYNQHKKFIKINNKFIFNDNLLNNNAINYVSDNAYIFQYCYDSGDNYNFLECAYLILNNKECLKQFLKDLKNIIDTTKHYLIHELNKEDVKCIFVKNYIEKNKEAILTHNINNFILPTTEDINLRYKKYRYNDFYSGVGLHEDINFF